MPLIYILPFLITFSSRLFSPCPAESIIIINHLITSAVSPSHSPPPPTPKRRQSSATHIRHRICVRRTGQRRVINLQSGSIGPGTPGSRLEEEKALATLYTAVELWQALRRHAPSSYLDVRTLAHFLVYHPLTLLSLPLISSPDEVVANR